MSKDIVKLADKTNNGFMQSIEYALEDALKQVGKNGAFEKGSKILILALDDTEENYSISFIQGGMKMSECVGLCETAKTIFLSEMNYINSERG